MTSSARHSTLKGLRVVKQVAEQTTPIAELRQVETILNSLGNKLASTRRFISPPEQKRGILNIGRILLKSLFGTATVMGPNELHTAVNKL
jgi:hypothetical protein